MKQGKLIALSAPSGTGKTTLARKLIETDNDIELSAILRGDVNASYNADQHDRADPSPAPNPAPIVPRPIVIPADKKVIPLNKESVPA